MLAISFAASAGLFGTDCRQAKAVEAGTLAIAVWWVELAQLTFLSSYSLPTPRHTLRICGHLLGLSLRDSRAGIVASWRSASLGSRCRQREREEPEQAGRSRGEAHDRVYEWSLYRI